MASKRILPGSAQQASNGELSVLTTMSNDLIKRQRCGDTHVHTPHKKFDVGSLFAVVKNILNPATIHVDNVVQGIIPKQAYEEIQGERGPEASFIPPLCILKQLSYEMACKAPDEEIVRQTTKSILNILSSYSWDAKAVLTLGAFALDYGEFWHLAQFHSSDPLTKSLGILKRVVGIEKHGKAIVELNNLIKDTLDVIECIFKLAERSAKSNYDTKDLPALSKAMEGISEDVIWAIKTVVACTTQMRCLFSNEDKTQELVHFAEKIKVILNFLKLQIELCDGQIADIEEYRNLQSLLQNPTQIVEVFKALFFAGERRQGGNGLTNELNISIIEVVKSKNVLLFFSGLDIADENISNLKSIHEEISKNDQYKIVWIPIVEQWTNEMQNKLEKLGSNMPWYTVYNFSSVSGIKYVKEEWQFKSRPIIVVLNPQGIVKHQNALHMIKVWGINAFPFTIEKEQEVSTGKDWFRPFIFDINPDVSTWINQDKYILFYGGNDNKWIQEFTQKAIDLASDPVIKSAKIPIEKFCVGKDSTWEDDLGILGRFWILIENFISKSQDPVTQEIKKLISYKTGWAVLCKGSTFVLSGPGTTVLKVLEQFNQWKHFVQPQIKFEVCFKGYHEMILKAGHPFNHFDIPTNDGNIPAAASIKCPDCRRVMEMCIRFKCFHTDQWFCEGTVLEEHIPCHGNI